MHKILGRTPLGNIKQQRLGPVNGFVDFALLIVAERCNLPTRRNQAPEQRRTFDSFGVVFDVVRGRHGIDEFVQIQHATHLIELVASPQLFRDHGGIWRYAVVEARQHGIVDQGMPLQVKVLGQYPRRNGSQRITIQQYRPEGRTLRFNVVG